MGVSGNKCLNSAVNVVPLVTGGVDSDRCLAHGVPTPKATAGDSLRPVGYRPLHCKEPDSTIPERCLNTGEGQGS